MERHIAGEKIRRARSAAVRQSDSVTFVIVGKVILDDGSIGSGILQIVQPQTILPIAVEEVA
jgi:hypothetical protein